MDSVVNQSSAEVRRTLKTCKNSKGCGQTTSGVKAICGCSGGGRASTKNKERNIAMSSHSKLCSVVLRPPLIDLKEFRSKEHPGQMLPDQSRRTHCLGGDSGASETTQQCRAAPLPRGDRDKKKNSVSFRKGSQPRKEVTVHGTISSNVAGRALAPLHANVECQGCS